MERYTVTIALPPGTSAIRLLIPFPPTSSVSALVAEVKKRVSRSALLLDAASDLILRLGDFSGPILDEDDLLEDVILDSKVESITATPRDGLASTGVAPLPEQNHVSSFLSIYLNSGLIYSRLLSTKHHPSHRALKRSRSA